MNSTALDELVVTMDSPPFVKPAIGESSNGAEILWSHRLNGDLYANKAGDWFAFRLFVNQICHEL